MKTSKFTLIKSLFAVCLLAIGLNKAAASIDPFATTPVSDHLTTQSGPAVSCDFGDDGGGGF